MGRWLRMALGLLAIAALGCPTGGREAGVAAEVAPSVAEPLREARVAMVQEQIAARGISDPRVLEAMRTVPRHRFLPPDREHAAHRDHPVAIGHGQTISQPYIVALMTQLAAIEPGARVLEIGTGSGYQAAVLAEAGARVWSIEIVEPLADRAESLLAELGYDSVVVRRGDGYAGWPDQAPFDAIVLTAAPPRIPEPLLAQLKMGGRLVAPVGRHRQELIVVTRQPQGLVREVVLPVRFVPMTGRAQSP